MELFCVTCPSRGSAARPLHCPPTGIPFDAECPSRSPRYTRPSDKQAKSTLPDAEPARIAPLTEVFGGEASMIQLDERVASCVVHRPQSVATNGRPDEKTDARYIVHRLLRRTQLDVPPARGSVSRDP